jgi:hypothetical protein
MKKPTRRSAFLHAQKRNQAIVKSPRIFCMAFTSI